VHDGAVSDLEVRPEKRATTQLIAGRSPGGTPRWRGQAAQSKATSAFALKDNWINASGHAALQRRVCDGQCVRVRVMILAKSIANALAETGTACSKSLVYYALDETSQPTVWRPPPQPIGRGLTSEAAGTMLSAQAVDSPLSSGKREVVGEGLHPETGPVPRVLRAPSRPLLRSQ